MVYQIIHQTKYIFSEPVFLEPHHLRFLARSTAVQKVRSFALDIDPFPEGLRPLLDAENNTVHFCWFAGLYPQLSITATSTVEVEAHNPFNFILYPARFLQIPFSYAAEDQIHLAAFLRRPVLSTALTDYADRILTQTEGSTTSFLSALTQNIHAGFAKIYREEGPPWQPDVTFSQKEGSCRDLAWMQVQLLRHLGIAARFVSGYFYPETLHPAYELHAWVEAFLPGAGWIGFDPTHGLAVGEAHIPLVASADYADTMPVSGSIRGAAHSTLHTQLEISRH